MSTLTGSATRKPAPSIGRKPGVDINAIMRSEKLAIAEIGIGGRKACIDFMYFGECARSGCSYEHGPARNVSAANAATALSK